DLLVLERTINEKTNKLYQDIRVDDVRRTVTFFGSTAGEGGWRVAIVDPVDELNPSGANALLKILDEPPRRALLLFASHLAPSVSVGMAGGRVAASARRPPVAAGAGGRPDTADTTAVSAAADGSVRRALALLAGDALDLRNRIMDLLEHLPAVDPRALHALGDRLYGTDPAPLAAFVDTVNAWLSLRLSAGEEAPARRAGLAEVWEKFNAAARDADTFNLERKPLVFNVFSWLAEASRG